MAPGPGGDLFVSIPRSRGSVLALLDPDGRPRTRWPITVKNSTSCGLLLPVEDGSVRIACNGTDLPQFDNDVSDARAFAFDAGGRLMAGWPIELRPGPGIVVGDEWVYVEQQIGTDTYNADTVSHAVWVTRIAADGAIRRGARAPMVGDAERWAVGPDGVAYGVANQLGDSSSAPKSSKLLAVGVAGVPAGFPVALDGIVSPPAFDAAGRIHVSVLKVANGPARTLVFDTHGQAVVGGSDEVGISASDDCAGIEGSCEVPAAPLVGPDGTVFVIESDPGTTVVGLSPSGRVMAGWPYRTDAGLQTIGYRPPGEVDSPIWLATPALGPGNVLYLPLQARKETVGGSLVAVGPDGKVRPGWPVSLKKPGAEFWKVVVGADGTVYALAIEPESSRTSSATILAIAPDSTVLWTTTIVDP